MPAFARHVRASSDPVSRGGAFPANASGHGLDQEPNPFEQSFSGPRHSSTGPLEAADVKVAMLPNALAGPSSGVTIRRARSISPPTQRARDDASVPKLPPLSLIASRGQPHEMQGFGWGIDSLRSGPLSPALLNGPAHQPTNGAFDPSGLRTSLTPLSGVGNAAFPPPSPATAALFAMMTNNTPGSSDLGMGGGGSRPHEGPNEGNHFEASFARATDGKGSRRSSLVDQSRGMGGGNHDNYLLHHQGPQAPLNSHPRSTQMNGRPIQMHPSQLGQHSMPYASMNSRLPMQNGMPTSLSSRLPNLPSDIRYAPQSHGGGQNPLYLLSQANDNNEETQAAAAALGNLSGPGGYSPLPMDTSGDHLGMIAPGTIGEAQQIVPSAALQHDTSSNAGPVATPKGGRKTAAAKRKKGKDDDDVVRKPAAKKGKRGKAAKDDYDMDDFDDPGDEGSLSPQPVNPNETEEEKRKNFLERNRQGTSFSPALGFC